MVETEIFIGAAEHALADLVAEYERRLNLGVGERGPNLLHEAEHLAVEFDADGRPRVALNLSPESRLRARRELARGMEQYFEPGDAAPEMEHEAGLEGFDERGDGHHALAQRIAQEYLDALGAGGLSAAQLEVLVGLSPPGNAEAVPVPEKHEGHWYTGASLVFQRLREVVAQGTFERVEGSPWPTADITAPSRKVSGHAILVPPRFDGGAYMPPEEAGAWAEIMWRQREELSDLDADMLDALCAMWISQAKDPRDSALATVDDLLWMRGVKPKLGGAGRRGGYEPVQREAVMRALTRLENVWLTISEMEVYEPQEGRKKTKAKKMTAQSRPFVITDRVGQMRLDGGMEVERFRFRPGEIFGHYLGGPGRQVALLSAAALAYDPYREIWEKRLAKYLSWRWKTVQGGAYFQPYRVATLLERAGQKVEARNPLRTRERLEKALDRLHRDSVIAGWQYDRFHDRLSESRKGWVERWLACTVVIEPPDIIKEIPGGGVGGDAREGSSRSRKRITVAAHDAGPPKMPAGTEKDILARKVARRRKELKLSQLRLAERLGVSQALVSKVERGKEAPSAALSKKMAAFLGETGGGGPEI